MSNRLRKPLIIVLVLVTVLVGLRLLLAWLVPSETIRETVAEEIRKATGARVELGEISVGLLPRLALRLDASTLQGTGEALAQATGSPNDLVSYDLQVEGLSAALKPAALLRGRIETGLIRLQCAEALLRLNEGELLARNLVVEVFDFGAAIGGLTAAAESEESLPPGETIPEDLALGFEVRAEQLVWEGAAYDAIRCRGELDGRVISIDEIEAQRSTGRISGSAEIDYDRDPWGLLDFEARVEAVPAVSLLQQWSPGLGAKLDCDLSGEVSGGCALKDEATTQATLDLTGRLHSGEGVLGAREWLKDIARYLGERQDLQDVRFRSLEHTFRVSDGRYQVEELALEGPDTDWTGNGWVGLDGTIDLDLTVKLPAGFTPDLGQMSFLADGLRDDEGRVNLTLRLSGESARPTVGLKLAGARDAARDAGADAVEKGLGGFLDKLKSK